MDVTYVATQVKERHGVTLKRVPLAGTADVLNKLLGEKQAERATDWGDFPAFDPGKVPAGIKTTLGQIDLSPAVAVLDSIYML